MAKPKPIPEDVATALRVIDQNFRDMAAEIDRLKLRIKELEENS